MYKGRGKNEQCLRYNIVAGWNSVVCLFLASLFYFYFRVFPPCMINNTGTGISRVLITFICKNAVEEEMKIKVKLTCGQLSNCPYSGQNVFPTQRFLQ